MALVINNRVRETTSTTGTGAVTLGGAVGGFQTFAAGIGNSNTTYYAISINSENEWEVGLGTLNGDSSTLTRTTVLESSNSDSAVDFSAGSKEVFCTLPSEKAVYLDASDNQVGGFASLVADTTPQLGGDLDLNSNNIDFPTTANISDCLDEDAMGSDSATKLATQQSIKAYADTKLANVSEDTTPQLGGNLDCNGNDIVSTSNADIDIIPNGTGDVNLGADTVQVGDNDADATITTQGTGDLILNTNNGSNAGNITLLDGANGNIKLSPNGTGEILVGAGDATGDITTNGAYDLIIDTNEGTNAGNITLANGANGNIEFTNNGTGVVKFNDAAYYPEADLNFDATQDWDVQASPVAKVTLTDNVTFDAPSNPTTGQFISILCIQDNTGSRTVAWDGVFQFASAEAPTATTTADKGDLFSFRYNGAKWLCVGTTLALTLS